MPDYLVALFEVGPFVKARALILKYLVSCLALFFVFNIAWALPPVTSCFKNSAFDAMKSLVHPIMNIDEADRRTEENFAAENNMTIQEVQKRYGPTGLIDCPNEYGSANVVMSGNVIISVSHIFHSSDCKSVESPMNCRFETTVGGEKQSFKIKKVHAWGRQCPTPKTSTNDWVVMILDREVPNVSPYEVNEETAGNIRIGKNVTAVSAKNLDIWDGAGKRFTGKTIGKCKTKQLYSSTGTKTTLVGTNCDLSKGASGGALLDDRGDRPALMGIAEGGSETERQLREAIRNKKPNSGPFDEDKWASGYIPVQDEMLKAIQSASAENGR